MKRMMIAVLIVALCGLVLPATAQDPATISYGQTFTGTITNLEFEQLYTFEGVAGDTILAVMEPTADSEFYTPALLLLDLEGLVIASQSNWSQALLAYTLPSTGTYTLIASRQDGRGGDAEGDYQIRLLLPTVLERGTPRSSAVSDAMLSDYYLVPAEADVQISYTRDSGIYAPSLRLWGISTEDIGAVDDMGGIEIPSQLGGSVSLPGGESVVYLVEVSVSSLYQWDTSLTPDTGYTIQID